MRHIWSWATRSVFHKFDDWTSVKQFENGVVFFLFTERYLEAWGPWFNIRRRGGGRGRRKRRESRGSSSAETKWLVPLRTKSKARSEFALLQEASELHCPRLETTFGKSVGREQKRGESGRKRTPTERFEWGETARPEQAVCCRRQRVRLQRYAPIFPEQETRPLAVQPELGMGERELVVARGRPGGRFK